MSDWTGQDGSTTSARYLQMVECGVRGVSPSYERLCLGVADGPDVLALLDTLPPPKRQPNLLLAAVRFLDGPVDSYPTFRAFVLARWDQLSATMLQRRTQTNEPRRCATLLPVLSALPQPLALLEIGASAGLCLYPDRYAYRYLTDDGEHRVGTGPVEFSCTVSGPVPLPGRVPEVAWRAGLDLNPLDVRDDEDVRWLESLIWPEQHDRFDLLRGAVQIARAEPPRIERGDLLTDLPSLVAQVPPEATFVLSHSAVLAYLGVADRIRFADIVRALERPPCWLSNEAPRVLAGTAQIGSGRSCFVLARDGAPVALTGPHGQSLEWLA